MPSPVASMISSTWAWASVGAPRASRSARAAREFVAREVFVSRGRMGSVRSGRCVVRRSPSVTRAARRVSRESAGDAGSPAPPAGARCLQEPDSSSDASGMRVKVSVSLFVTQMDVPSKATPDALSTLSTSVMTPSEARTRLSASPSGSGTQT